MLGGEPHGGGAVQHVRLAPDRRGAAGTGTPQDPEEAGAKLASCKTLKKVRGRTKPQKEGFENLIGNIECP